MTNKKSAKQIKRKRKAKNGKKTHLTNNINITINEAKKAREPKKSRHPKHYVAMNGKHTTNEAVVISPPPLAQNITASNQAEERLLDHYMKTYNKREGGEYSFMKEELQPSLNNQVIASIKPQPATPPRPEGVKVKPQKLKKSKSKYTKSGLEKLGVDRLRKIFIEEFPDISHDELNKLRTSTKKEAIALFLQNMENKAPAYEKPIVEEITTPFKSPYVEHNAIYSEVGNSTFKEDNPSTVSITQHILQNQNKTNPLARKRIIRRSPVKSPEMQNLINQFEEGSKTQSGSFNLDSDSEL